MSDLTVIIKGLAFCNPKFSATQILFPHAPGHELKATRGILGGQLEPEQLFPGEHVLKITAQNNASPIDPPVPPNNDLINIAHWHNQAGSKLSFRIRDSDPASMRISFLSLPKAKIFSASAASDLEYEIWAHRTGGSKPLRDFLGHPPRKLPEPAPLPSRKLAEQALIKYRIPAAASGAPVPSVKFFVDDLTTTPVETFVHQAGVNYVLILDNHCADPPCVPDFGYYYEMLEGTDKEGHNVEINEFPIRTRPENTPLGPDSEAACNPVMGFTRCDLDKWRLGGPGCAVTENP